MLLSSGRRCVLELQVVSQSSSVFAGLAIPNSLSREETSERFEASPCQDVALTMETAQTQKSVSISVEIRSWL